jgi:hypothetical protein
MRFAAIVLLTLVLVFGCAGCGGNGSSSAAVPSTIVFSPATLSLAPGQMESSGAEVENSTGTVLSGQTVTFTTSDPAVADISTTTTTGTNGLVCAGTWDSESAPVVCCPGTWDSTGTICTPAPKTGIVTITATDSTSSGTATGTLTVYVHDSVDTVMVTPTVSSPECVSGAGKNLSGIAIGAGINTFTATAYHDGTDITSEVGPFSWSSTPSAVATADTSGVTCTGNATKSCPSSVPSPDFVIAGVPTSVPVVQGNSGTATVAVVALNGFSSDIALSAAGQPAGVTISFSPSSIAIPAGASSSTMSLVVASGAAAGTYPITVAGSGNGTTHTATVSLIVTAAAAADFNFTTLDPPVIRIMPATSGAVSLATTALNGFDSTLSLVAAGQPAGTTITFNPSSIPAAIGSTVMTISVATNTTPGTFPVTVTAEGGGQTHTATVILVVLDAALCNQCIFAAGQPGQTTVSARVFNVLSVTGTNSLFNTCPVRAIVLADTSNGTGTSSPVKVGTTTEIIQSVSDTKGVTLDLLPGLITTQPAIVSVGAIGASGVSAGVGNVISACTPSSCNLGTCDLASGLLYCPIFSNPYRVEVTGSSASTAYVASATVPPNGASPLLIPINTTTDAVGTAITLPSTPNSMVMSPAGDKILLGADNPGPSITTNVGVMNYNISGVTVSTIGYWGKVLAIAPNGNLAVIFDPKATSNNQVTPTVYLYSASPAGVTAYPMASAVRAAFSPDSSRAFVVGGNQLVVLSTTAAPQAYTIGTVNDVDFLTQGSFAFLAGGSANVTAYATCNATLQDSITTPGLPTLIKDVPNAAGAPTGGAPFATQILAADSPNIDAITVTLPAPIGAGCPPALADSPPVVSNFGVGSFTANQLVVTPDSSMAYVLASNQPALLQYDIATRATSTIDLSTLATGVKGTTTGATTQDSAYLFFGLNGVSDVAVLDLSTGTVTAIPVTFTNCSSCGPDFVTVQP